MTQILIVKKFESLVDVLENPQVCLNIERSNVVAKTICIFEYAKLNIRTC